ncbi:MAG: ABC transporter ATP-binding protein/permease [Pleurocapsa minor GSE-CHR-MK-17-07R]|nr:ABC transporter ATP-binding protein/permease [Pleurocapsa minor GSE-CHR-MK 17-07R]
MKQSAAPQADFTWMFGYLLRHKRAMILTVVFGVVGGVTFLMEPFLIGSLVDQITAGVPFSELTITIGLLLLFGLITVISFFGQRYFSGVLAYSVNYDVRQTLFDNMLTLDQSFYNAYSSGDLISRMHSDAEQIWRLVVIASLRGISSLTGLVIIFVLLSGVDLTLTLVAFSVLVVSTAVQVWAGLSLAPKFERVQEQGGVLSAQVQDAISGIQTLKSFGRESGASQQYAAENAEYRRRWLYFKRRNEPVGMLPNMISQFVVGVVVVAGGVMAVNGALSLGNFTRFMLYLGMISTLLLQVGAIYQRYQQTRGALTRLTPLLQPAKIVSREQAPPLHARDADIQFDHVSLVLDGSPVLHDINLTVPAGTTTAIVGPTGSGKTLLMQLLLRITDPTSGSVRIGGRDIREVDLDSLRASIAFVPQSTFLFSRTLDENLRMGAEEIEREALEQAIQVSRLSADLGQLPRKLDTLVGEKGVMLSGGQKQRVAIARAIVRDPAILVLDDALSSVDTHNAADILRDLHGILQSRTSFIIAHRMATVKNADFIVVMDEGRIVEQGTHEELLRRGGAYAGMIGRELEVEPTGD